jgi:hypothetical protein
MMRCDWNFASGPSAFQVSDTRSPSESRLAARITVEDTCTSLCLQQEPVPAEAEYKHMHNAL